MPSSNIVFFKYRDNKMAAGGANGSPFPEVVVLFVLEERGPSVQVGQVAHVLYGGVLAWR